MCILCVEPPIIRLNCFIFILFLSRTIKPLLKKPDEEIKREPSPELAKISALVTRPPKQKSTSKKTEEGLLDGSPALPTDSFSANLTSVPPASAPRKKSIYQSEPLPTPHFDPVPKLPNPLALPQQLPYYFVSTFITILIQWELLKFSFGLIHRTQDMLNITFNEKRSFLN